jgi:hypothetical protein
MAAAATTTTLPRAFKDSLHRTPSLVVAIGGVLITLAVAAMIVLTVAKRRAEGGCSGGGAAAVAAFAAAAAPAPAEPQDCDGDANAMSPRSSPCDRETAEAVVAALELSRVYDAAAGAFVVPPGGAAAAAQPPLPVITYHAETSRIAVAGPPDRPFVTGRYWLQSTEPSGPAAGGIRIVAPVHPVVICMHREIREALAAKRVFLWLNFAYTAAS